MSRWWRLRWLRLRGDSRQRACDQFSKTTRFETWAATRGHGFAILRLHDLQGLKSPDLGRFCDVPLGTQTLKVYEVALEWTTKQQSNALLADEEEGAREEDLVLKSVILGTSLEAQWLRLQSSTAGSMGSILAGELRSQRPHGKKKKDKRQNKQYFNKFKKNFFNGPHQKKKLKK